MNETLPQHIAGGRADGWAAPECNMTAAARSPHLVAGQLVGGGGALDEGVLAAQVAGVRQRAVPHCLGHEREGSSGIGTQPQHDATRAGGQRSDATEAPSRAPGCDSQHLQRRRHTLQQAMARAGRQEAGKHAPAPVIPTTASSPSSSSSTSSCCCCRSSSSTISTSSPWPPLAACQCVISPEEFPSCRSSPCCGCSSSSEDSRSMTSPMAGAEGPAEAPGAT